VKKFSSAVIATIMVLGQILIGLAVYFSLTKAPRITLIASVIIFIVVMWVHWYKRAKEGKTE